MSVREPVCYGRFIAVVVPFVLRLARAVVWVPYASLVAGATSVGLYGGIFASNTPPITLSARKVPIVLSWFVVLWRFRSCRGSRGLLL